MTITLTEQEYAEAWAEEAAFEGHKRRFPVNLPKVHTSLRAHVSERRKKVAKLHRQGLSTREIARLSGVSRARVREDIAALKEKGKLA